MLKFETIKKMVVEEKYNSTDLELAAFGGNLEEVAKLLKTKGKSSENAGQFAKLIQDGMSEEEALSQIV